MAAPAEPQTRPAVPLPYDDPRHLEVSQLLVEEAHLFDTQQYDEWLAMLCADIRYVMPVRVTTAKNAEIDPARLMGHFDEDFFSLRKRVDRFNTEHAFTEDPPSRLRHYVTNVRTFEGDQPGELRVESYVLLFRSRGDVRPAEWISAARVDAFRRDGGRLKLAHRMVIPDEAVLHMQNLAIFL